METRDQPTFSPTAVLMLDTDGRIVSAGLDCEAVLQCPAEELVGQAVSAVLEPGPGRDAAAHRDEPADAGRSPAHRREVYHRRDGYRLQVEIPETGRHPEGIRPATVLWLVRDTGGELPAERYRDRIFNHSLDLICIAGFDGYLRDLNAALVHFSGVPKDELLCRPFLDFVHPDDHVAAGKELERLRGGDVVRYFEVRCRRLDGEYAWVAWKAVPDEGEGIFYALGRDVSALRDALDTQRRLAGELQNQLAERGLALERSRRFLSRLMESLPDGLILTDGNRTIVEVNGSFCELFHLREDDVLNRPLAEVLRELGALPMIPDRVMVTNPAGSLAGDFLSNRVGHLVVRIIWTDVEVDLGGPANGRLYILEDHTQQIMAEQAVKESERCLRRHNEILVNLSKNKLLLSGDLAATMNLITETAAGALDVDRVGIWLFNEDRTCIACRDLYDRQTGRHSAGLELHARDCPVYFKTLEQDRTISAHDAVTDPRTSEFADHYLVPQGIGAMLDAPIRLSGRTVGIVCHEHVGPPRRWNAEEEVFAGSMADFVALALETSEHRRAEDYVRLAAKVFESNSEGIVITDAEANILDVNLAFTTITGFTREDVVGRNPRIMKSGRHGPDFFRKMWQTLGETGRWQGEIWDQRKNGEIYPKWLSISASMDDTGRITHYIGIFTDITRIKQTEDYLQYVANYDSLTGLPNINLFRDRGNQAFRLADRSRRLVAVMVIDMDRFNYINETMGYRAGDQLLVQVGRRMVAGLQQTDTLAYLDRDTFLVLLPDLHRTQDGVRIAQRLKESLRRSFHFGEREFFLSASMGLAFYPPDGKEMDELLKNAEAALHHAKNLGKNTLQCYSAGMQQETMEWLEMETGLRYAVENDELELYYHPQMDLAEGHLVGLEALLRWRHPTLGQVPPDKFIPLAEETGLIIPMVGQVLGKACHQARAWQELGSGPLRVAVNLSAVEFHHPDLVDTVRQALETSGLPPGLLELEITERIIMREEKETIRTLRRLKDIGICLSIDDFGTSYSCLNYLRQFPIDKLKIDKTFVSHLQTSSSDAAITRAIIFLAHSLGLKVIAEGVETREQLEFLRQFGCDEIQGFIISVPLPASEMTRLLEGGDLPDPATAGVFD